MLALVTAVLLLVAGALAARPATALASRRGALGVALLLIGVADLLWLEVPKLVRHGRVGYALTIYAAIGAAIVLGVLRGGPHLVGWIAGDTPAEQRALDMQRALADHETGIGAVAAIAGALLLAFELGLLGRT
jgi:hypothetical protein